MKKIVTILVLSFTLLTTAQAPQGFNYQATVRNSAGVLIANQNVFFKFNILLNSQTSLPVYSETHYVPTDDLGQVNLNIGSGTPTFGSFTAINWGVGSYYLGIELDTGAGYVAMGTTQLLSVPYALYANSAGNSQVATPNLVSVLAVNNGAGNLQIKNLANPTDNQDAVTKLYSDIQLQSQVAQLQAQITAIINGTPALLPNVTFGTQSWTTTNLDVITYRDGTPIPQVTDPAAWATLTTGAWCYYNNETANGTTYGKLYNWFAVAGIHDTDSTTPNKILAPTGWHVPTNTEWTTLTNFIGGTNWLTTGGKMKSIGTSLWRYPNLSATNSSGFTGFPGGYRFHDGRFFGIGDWGRWWCSGYAISTMGWNHYLKYDSDTENVSSNEFQCGFTVRCLRD